MNILINPGTWNIESVWKKKQKNKKMVCPKGVWFFTSCWGQWSTWYFINQSGIPKRMGTFDKSQPPTKLRSGAFLPTMIILLLFDKFTYYPQLYSWELLWKRQPEAKIRGTIEGRPRMISKRKLGRAKAREKAHCWAYKKSRTTTRNFGGSSREKK